MEKRSVSFDAELGQAVRSSAEREGTGVSAWLARSAREQLRLEALGGAMLAWEQRCSFGRWPGSTRIRWTPTCPDRSARCA